MDKSVVVSVSVPTVTTTGVSIVGTPARVLTSYNF
jgi:hypothetical protein